MFSCSWLSFKDGALFTSVGAYGYVAWHASKNCTQSDKKTKHAVKHIQVLWKRQTPSTWRSRPFWTLPLDHQRSTGSRAVKRLRSSEPSLASPWSNQLPLKLECTSILTFMVNAFKPPRIKRQPPCLKSEANAKVPWTCILSNGQHFYCFNLENFQKFKSQICIFNLMRGSFSRGGWEVKVY